MGVANLTHYDDEFIAHALSVLKANGGNAKETARVLGVSRSTLRGWAGRMVSKTAQPRRVDEPIQSRSDAELAGKFEYFLMRVFDLPDEVWDAKIKKASLRDLLQATDIATRGRALLSGGPTARTANLHVSLVAPDVLRGDTVQVLERTDSGQVRTVRALPATTIPDE